MSYVKGLNRLEVEWDPPGSPGGVLIRRRIAGRSDEWRVPANGMVNQAMAADLLGVTRMTVNNWVRGGKLRHLKFPGQPSAIPLSEVKRIRRLLERERRIRGSSGP